ncbi:MAG: DUF1015 domain-containing protein [Treponema sp.]|nr:DUF1015 domain-containing protein [Treponema sp.]
MSSFAAVFDQLGLRVPEVYLPSAATDLSTWAVVACDQYSSERDYWNRVETTVSGASSTLNLVFPEAFLEDADKADRISRIQSTMHDYLARGVLESRGEGFILVERYTPYERKPRVGLVVAVDLEKYEYGRASRSLIRPTEGTIVERLPPRMQIRRGAPLELPHIMLLVDDPKRSLIEPLYDHRSTLPKLYDFELMLGSGRVRGWQVKEPARLERFAAALEALADPAAYRTKYGRDDVLLFAVGDGNHSLATAKAIWEETKKERPGDPDLATHPARWALVELVNIYDEGLPFHPIHRVLFGVDESRFFADLAVYQEHKVEKSRDAASAFAAAEGNSGASHRVAFVSSKGSGLLTFPRPRANLAVGTIQEFLDAFLKANPGVGIDYIHGRESLEALAVKPGNLGLYLPPLDKAGFFGTVIRDGVMPRKTFSMGEAPEKRFYVEARKIVR